MTLSIKLPDFDFPAVVPKLVAYSPEWNTDRVSKLAQRLGIDAEADDAGLWYIARSDRAILEVFQASQSFRFSRRDVDGEALDGSDGAPDSEKAIDIAHGWLAPFPGSEMSVHSVSDREVLVAARDSDEPKRLVAGLDVNMQYAVHGMPLIGSGAKAKVSVDREGNIMEAYRFWRDFDISGETKLQSPKTIAERFGRSELFSDLSDDTAKVEVTSARFGYFCLPPTELASSLAPVVEVRGVLATKEQDRYEFTRYISAIAKEDRKRLKLAASQGIAIS
jgi:hypothetical protein